jgi:hypothetical protein
MTGDYRLSLGDQVLPILYGIILLIVAHFVGQFLKQVVIKGMHRLRIDHHINNLTKGNVAVDLTQPL